MLKIFYFELNIYILDVVMNYYVVEMELGGIE